MKTISLMRLSSIEIKKIIDVAKEVYGSSVKVFLFGSRTDDSKRGGDIDLLIRTETQEKLGFMGRVLMRAKLKMVLGDQKFDIVGDHEESDFVQSIINGAILLNDAI